MDARHARDQQLGQRRGRPAEAVRGCAFRRVYAVKIIGLKVTDLRVGSVDVIWWTSLFTYNGSRGSGRGPWVTGHINALFPWGSPAKEHGEEAPPPQKFCWVGTEARKFSFPDGMSTAPLIWRFLGKEFPMRAWSGSTCACVSEDGSEVAPAVCVGFTIDSPSPNP
jgi:hypothetical protein